MPTALFRYPHGALPNSTALGYTLVGFVAGVWLLFSDHWALAAAGVLLTAHALTLSAYFVHEFAHQSVFASAQTNQRWGTFMSWINGSCYAPFAALRRKHMRHHIDRADVLTFDFKRFLRASPRWFQRVVIALEWAYVPAVELIMHAYVVVLPFVKDKRKAERPRVIAIVAVRAAAFALMAWVSVQALLLYAVSYMIMLHALRFTDAYQHTYDAFAVLEEGEIPADKVRDRDYEQGNTYSNLVSVAHPWLNLLLLNFSYHNAHHERPIEPWHELPRLHAQLFPTQYVQVVAMSRLLKGYHRDRIGRVVSDDYGEVRAGDFDRFIGAVGVSFLTAV
jgi:fatty acid desaturase